MVTNIARQLNFPPTSHVIHSVSLQRNEPRQIKLCCILLTTPHFMCTYGVDMWPRTHTHAATVHESLFYSVSRYDSSPSWLQQWHCYSMSDQSVDLKKEKKPILLYSVTPWGPISPVAAYSSIQNHLILFLQQLVKWDIHLKNVQPEYLQKYARHIQG